MSQLTHEVAGPGAEGKILNHSPTAQQELVVFAVARHGAAIVAAGRAVIPEAAPSGATHFQLFFTGSPAGASVSYRGPADDDRLTRRLSARGDCGASG